MTPLTQDFGALKADINSWIPEGSTYIPAGIIWGWRTLSPNVPFEQARNNPNGENVMILMTDGDNTRSIGGEIEHSQGLYHIGTVDELTTVKKRASGDALTTELCEGMKASGIRVITVTFRATREETKEMFRNCASGPSDAYNAANNEDLPETFKKVSDSLITDDYIRLMR